VVGIIGPNGSGKTTLFRVILGLTRADSGTVVIDGVEQIKRSTFERSMLSFIPDTDELYEDLTPRETAQLEWAVTARLAGTKGRFPEVRFDELTDIFEMSSHANRKLRNLSHGTRRKAQLCSALTCRPGLLIVDEPTNGLDPDQLIAVKYALRSLAASGSAVVVSTHNLGFAEETCDTVVLLRSRVLIAGTVDHVTRTSGARSLSAAYEKLSGADYGKVRVRLAEALS
jgi:ABC-2 type transport system ATP-binding protein